MPTFYDLPLADLNLSSRAHNALAEKRISTVAGLVGMTWSDVLRLRQFGMTSARELRRRLYDHGFPVTDLGVGKAFRDRPIFEARDLPDGAAQAVQRIAAGIDELTAALHPGEMIEITVTVRRPAA